MKVFRKSQNVTSERMLMSFNSGNLNIEKSVVWALNLNGLSHEIWRRRKIYVVLSGACQDSPGPKLFSRDKLYIWVCILSLSYPGKPSKNVTKKEGL